MKNIVGKEAKIFNYINGVFKAVSDYYRYEYIELPIMVDDRMRNDLESEAIKCYNLTVKSGFKKYSYLGSVYDSNKERNEFGFLAIDNNSLYQDAEMISMVYRILEELRIENISVVIKSQENYNLSKLQEYLEHLDVDYEIDDSGDLLDDFVSMSFEVIEQVGDKKIVLASGYKNENDINFIASTCYVDNILEVLNVVFEDYDFDNLTQVLIISEVEEERIAAMKLAQDLRWCEIKVEIDTLGKTRKEQLDVTNSNLIIDINKDDLNKGLIKVIDTKTHEETLIDESEIIDYIVSNL